MTKTLVLLFVGWALLITSGISNARKQLKFHLSI